MLVSEQENKLIDDIPADSWVVILTFLKLTDHLKLCQVSKGFKAFFESSIFWNKYLQLPHRGDNNFKTFWENPLARKFVFLLGDVVGERLIKLTPQFTEFDKAIIFQEPIKKLIESDKLSEQQVLSLKNKNKVSALAAFKMPFITSLIEQKKITTEQVFQLTPCMVNAMNSKAAEQEMLEEESVFPSPKLC